MRLLRSCLVACLATSLPAGAMFAQAGVVSTVSTPPAPAAAFAGSIAVSIRSGAVQSIGTVTDNTENPFPSSVSITLTWDLHPSTGAIQVIGYFANPAAAMTSGPASIPASWLKGRVLTADMPGAPTAYTAFAQTGAGGVGSAGGSLSLLTQSVLGYSKTGTRTFDLQLQLDLTGRVLTPGVYTGTLNIRAVTQ